MDREKKIAEIRKALEKATPGPWEYEMWEGCADVYPTTGRHVPICQLWTKTEEPMENAENNAHLIANAPEWLRFLLSELDRRDEENRKLRKERDDAREQAQKYYRKFEDEAEETLRLQDELQSAQQEIERLKQERAKLIEGLRWYADEDTHEIKRRVLGNFALITIDQGQRARDILHEIGVTVE